MSRAGAPLSVRRIVERIAPPEDQAALVRYAVLHRRRSRGSLPMPELREASLCLEGVTAAVLVDVTDPPSWAAEWASVYRRVWLRPGADGDRLRQVAHVLRWHLYVVDLFAGRGPVVTSRNLREHMVDMRVGLRWAVECLAEGDGAAADVQLAQLHAAHVEWRTAPPDSGAWRVRALADADTRIREAIARHRVTPGGQQRGLDAVCQAVLSDPALADLRGRGGALSLRSLKEHFADALPARSRPGKSLP